jgi:hypothetical protein
VYHRNCVSSAVLRHYMQCPLSPVSGTHSRLCAGVVFTGPTASPEKQAQAASGTRPSAQEATAPSRPTAREVDTTTRSSQTMQKQATKKLPATGPPTSSASSGETPSKGEEGGARSAPASADEILVKALKNFQVIHAFRNSISIPSPFPRPPRTSTAAFTSFRPRSYLSKKPYRRTVSPALFSARAFVLSPAVSVSLSSAVAPSLVLLFPLGLLS